MCTGGFEVGHRWVSILTYSRTFAMLYLLWTGDALATACKTWCTTTGHANWRGMCGRARGVEGRGPGVWGADGPCDVTCSDPILIVPRVDSLIESAGRMPFTEE